jgi:NodT family efflux transporter outer membrane factor (OMF) lipoprotein
VSLLGAALFFAGCNFAPKYERPPVQTPAAFKEIKAENATNVWKVAEPGDARLRDKWWEMFNDPQLNALQEQVSVSNQNVAAAFANFLAARTLVAQARSQLFPTVTANPSVARTRQSSGSGFSTSSGRGSTFTAYSLPFDASWQLDVWGRVRNAVQANVSETQATAADLENIRLTAHAELAVDYFQLRTQDALKQVYEETVRAYQEGVNLNKVRFETGISSDQDVAQAETQLETARAQGINVGILRAQLEHAIATIIGKPPAELSIPVEPLKGHPPAIPFGIPSELLERRPDVAAAERRVAEANAQIGVARAAYYPAVTLSASAGFQSASMTSLLNWSSRAWSVGAGLAETLFDAGARKAVVQQYEAIHERAAANYRQTVLTAFRQVEDNLTSLRILSEEVVQQEKAVNSSDRYLTLARDRYTLGIDSYLNVITAQTLLLGNRQTMVNLRAQQLTASVQLIEALGGGWDADELNKSLEDLAKPPNQKD